MKKLWLGPVLWVLLSNICMASFVKSNINFKKIEVLSVNYFQSPGNGHSAQISWVPDLVTFFDKFDFGARVGATLLPSFGDNEIWVTSIDILSSYKFSDSFTLEETFGADIWEGTDAYVEWGLNFIFNTEATSFFSKFSDEFIFGYAFVFNPDVDTHNVNLGFRKRF